MEVEIEIEGQVQNKKMTNLNGCYVTQFKHQPTQPVTVKNSTQKLNFKNGGYPNG